MDLGEIWHSGESWRQNFKTEQADSLVGPLTTPLIAGKPGFHLEALQRSIYYYYYYSLLLKIDFFS